MPVHMRLWFNLVSCVIKNNVNVSYNYLEYILTGRSIFNTASVIYYLPQDQWLICEAISYFPGRTTDLSSKDLCNTYLSNND